MQGQNQDNGSLYKEISLPAGVQTIRTRQIPEVESAGDEGGTWLEMLPYYYRAVQSAVGGWQVEKIGYQFRMNATDNSFSDTITRNIVADGMGLDEALALMENLEIEAIAALPNRVRHDFLSRFGELAENHPAILRRKLGIQHGHA